MGLTAAVLIRPAGGRNLSSPTGFSLDCSCGHTMVVQATQAGTTVLCRCGAQVKVPSLSKLREIAGQHAYETSSIDVIHGMLQRGELPAGGLCAVSGDPTEDVVELHVEAERNYRAGDNRLYLLLSILVSPLFLLGLFQKPRPDVGRETIVPTPLRVAAVYHAKVRRSGQRALKRWLRGIPIYAKLLEEYARARVRIGVPA
jgi:hypothetical protein